VVSLAGLLGSKPDGKPMLNLKTVCRKRKTERKTVCRTPEICVALRELLAVLLSLAVPRFFI